MQTRKPFLFILLCYTTLTRIEALPNRLGTLLEAAKKMGIASERVSDNKSRVYANGGVYEVYVYDPVDVEGKRAIDSDNYHSSYGTLSKLYVCVNCLIAERVRDELVKLVEPLPAFYRSEFGRAYDHVFANHVNDNGTTRGVLDEIERFADALLNFQSVFLRDYASDDHAPVLAALLSVLFEFELRRVAGADGSDVAAIRSIVGEINSMQHFVYLNCELSSRYDNRHFYGLRTTTRTDRGPDRGFLDDVVRGPRPGAPRCGAKKMLWLHVARPFGRTEWHARNGRAVCVEDAARRVARTRDFREVYRYAGKMFHTVMKHLFVATLEHYERYGRIAREIADKFETVFNTIRSTAIGGVSDDAIECFSLLRSTAKAGLAYAEDGALVKAVVRRYVRDRHDIVLNTAAGSLPDVYSVATANGFLDYLIAYGDHFRCFLRLLGHLRGRYEGAYYAPFANFPGAPATHGRPAVERDGDEIREPNESNVLEKNRRRRFDFLNNEGCEYFGTLYHVCWHASVELNLARSEDYSSVSESTEKLDYYPRIRHSLTKLKESLIELTADYWHLPHFKTVFNIIPQIELKPAGHYRSERHEDLTRMVHAIMAELNGYSVEFCSPPAHDFVFFNNARFDMTGKLTLLYNRARQSMQTLKNSASNYFPERKYFKTDVFESLFTTDGFRTYDAVIRVSWKGGNRSLTYIFNHLSSVAVSALDLYSFYDVSLKFVFAAMCFELHRVAGEAPTAHGKSESDAKLYSLMDDADAKKFPKKFANIIKMTRNYATFLLQNGRKSVTRRVTKELKKIGVFVELKKSTPLKLYEHSSYLADLDLIAKKVKKLSDLSIRVIESISILSNIENKF